MALLILKRILLPAVFLWIPLAGITQQIDSLEQVIEKRDLPDTARVDALVYLARELIFIEPARAASFAEEAMRSRKES